MRWWLACLASVFLVAGCAGGPGESQAVTEARAVAANGVVVPLPDGWVRGDAAGQGLVVLVPETEEDELPTEFLMGGPMGRSTLAGLAGAGFDEALEAIRDLHQGGPRVDEEVAVEGSERARLLRFDGVVVQEGAPPTTDLVILAADGGGDLWLFTYTALSGDYDQAVADDLVEGAAID